MPRFRAASLSLRCLPLLLLMLGTVARAQALGLVPTSGLGVERTAFTLRQQDGSLLKGVQLQGKVLNLPIEGDIHRLRLASITPDPADAGILRHEFEVETEPGRWQKACEPNIDGETWGFPIALAEGHPGREGAFTLSCASGAVVKCVRYGYAPWNRGRHGESLEPYHAACVQMIRADYAGDGSPHTKAGTYIRFHDDAVHWKNAAGQTGDGYAFEAGWSPQGAVCVARVRWDEYGALDAVRKSSRRLAAVTPEACTEAWAGRHGALIFNSSRLVPRLGR